MKRLLCIFCLFLSSLMFACQDTTKQNKQWVADFKLYTDPNLKNRVYDLSVPEDIRRPLFEAMKLRKAADNTSIAPMHRSFLEDQANRLEYGVRADLKKRLEEKLVVSGVSPVVLSVSSSVISSEDMTDRSTSVSSNVSSLAALKIEKTPGSSIASSDEFSDGHSTLSKFSILKRNVGLGLGVKTPQGYEIYKKSKESYDAAEKEKLDKQAKRNRLQQQLSVGLADKFAADTVESTRLREIELTGKVRLVAVQDLASLISGQVPPIAVKKVDAIVAKNARDQQKLERNKQEDDRKLQADAHKKQLELEAAKEKQRRLAQSQRDKDRVALEKKLKEEEKARAAEVVAKKEAHELERRRLQSEQAKQIAATRKAEQERLAKLAEQQKVAEDNRRKVQLQLREREQSLLAQQTIDQENARRRVQEENDRRQQELHASIAAQVAQARKQKTFSEGVHDSLVRIVNGGAHFLDSEGKATAMAESTLFTRIFPMITGFSDVDPSLQEKVLCKGVIRPALLLSRKALPQALLRYHAYDEQQGQQSSSRKDVTAKAKIIFDEIIEPTTPDWADNLRNAVPIFSQEQIEHCTKIFQTIFGEAIEVLYKINKQTGEIKVVKKDA